MSKTQCKACGHSSLAFDNYMDLSIPIPKQPGNFNEAIRLEDCLSMFIQEEVMEKCGYKCSKCKREDNFSK